MAGSESDEGEEAVQRYESFRIRTIKRAIVLPHTVHLIVFPHKGKDEVKLTDARKLLPSYGSLISYVVRIDRASTPPTIVQVNSVSKPAKGTVTKALVSKFVKECGWAKDFVSRQFRPVPKTLGGIGELIGPITNTKLVAFLKDRLTDLFKVDPVLIPGPLAAAVSPRDLWMGCFRIVPPNGKLTTWQQLRGILDTRPDAVAALPPFVTQHVVETFQQDVVQKMTSWGASVFQVDIALEPLMAPELEILFRLPRGPWPVRAAAAGAGQPDNSGERSAAGVVASRCCPHRLILASRSTNQS
jgi:hypothetical protein